MTPWPIVLLPTAGACAVALIPLMQRGSGDRGGRRVDMDVAAVIAVAVIAVVIVCAVWVARVQAAAEWRAWGATFSPTLAVVGFSRVMVVLVPTIALPVVAYAAASMRGEPGLPRLLALLTAFVGVMELLVCAADLLTLLVAWEGVGAISWALIAYEWEEPWRVQSARAAFLTTRFGDLGLYLAAAALFTGTGSLAFTALPALGRVGLSVAAAGILLAGAAKSAQLPFSPWLFSAMAGPTPASALLHSATMVAAGAYLLVRLSPVLAMTGWFGPTVAWLGVTTALVGGIVAMLQPDLKKALAASTSAQYGLMFAAIGAGVPAAAGVHLVTHAAFKALLFLGAGVVLHATNTLDLEVLRARRLGALLPRAAALFAVGMLALAAVPPLGAAYSKDQIIAAAARSGAWLTAGVLGAGLLSAVYAGRLQLLGYAAGSPAAREGVGRRVGVDRSPSRVELGAMAVLALLSLALGVLWLPAGARITEALAGSALAPGATWMLPASLALVALAFVFTWRLRGRGMLVTFAVPDPVRHGVADWFGLPALAQRAVVDPTLWLAHALATVDARVVDAGIRAAARFGTLLSGVLAWWADRDLDAVVTGIATATERIARRSGVVDDRAVDGAVEATARDVGSAGAWARALQSGAMHQYYTGLAVGTLVILAIALAGHLVASETVARLWTLHTGR